MPKASILLPVFNGERYLSQAIESVLNQTVDDFELLIADDASTDLSSSIIRDYAKQDPRIVAWTNSTNLGLFANYNECLKRASAEYIKPFAQDDLFEPVMLEKMIPLFEAEKTLALVSCARRYVDDEGREISVLREHNEDRSMALDDVLQDNLLGAKNAIGEPTTVMFRRAFAGEGFDATFPHLGDIEYWLRIIEHGTYRYYDTVLCDFRQHHGSATTQNVSRLQYVLDLAHLGEKHGRFLDKLNVSQDEYMWLVAKAVSRHVAWLAELNDISLSDFLAVEYETLEAVKNDLAVFKELTFNSFLIAGRTLKKNWALETKHSIEYNRLLAENSQLLSERKKWQENYSELEERYARLKTECKTAQRGHRILEDRCAELGKLQLDSAELCAHLQNDYVELKQRYDKLAYLHDTLSNLDEQYREILKSYSWQLTKPLREISRIYRGLKRRCESTFDVNKTIALENDHGKN